MPVSLKRRLACLLYEIILLFGLLFTADLIFSIVFQQRHALALRHIAQAWLFCVIGAYFIFCWLKKGQTLPMQTWRIGLVSRDGQPLTLKQVLLRYLLGWGWILPGLLVAKCLDMPHWGLCILPFLNVLLWSQTIYLDSNRQFLHDRLAGTQLIDVSCFKSATSHPQPPL